MNIVIPIPNLVLDKTIILNEIYFVSATTINQKHLNGLERLIHKNQDLLAESCDSFAIYHTNTIPDFSDNQLVVERLIKPVDYALDCLRIPLNTYIHHEQFIGIPGLYNGFKIAILFDDNYNFVQLIVGQQLLYLLVEGIGCNASSYVYDKKINKLLLSHREDEVYLKYREILHRCYSNMQTYSVDNCFSYLFSLAESLVDYERKLIDKKTKILSYISFDQKEYDVLSNQFYFFSKKVRTAVFHNGKSILDIIDWKLAYELLENLHLMIVRFCLKAIESGIKSFNDFEKELREHEKTYKNHIPIEEISINNMSSTPKEKCIYSCIISNLILDKITKLGNIIILPEKCNNLYFSIQQSYFYGLGIKNITGLNENAIIIEEDFPNYNLFHEYNKDLNPITVWDLDVILNYIHYNQIQEPTAILENQPYWNVKSKIFSFDYSAEFVDYICNKIQNAFNIFVLINFNNKSNYLPPLVGIKNGIRGAGVLPDTDKKIIELPGQIFGEYSDALKPYKMKNDQLSSTLYSCFFSKRTNEVFCTNRNALHRLAHSLYFYDSTHLIIEVFNILDMLLPEELNSKKIINHISTFISKSKSEKLNISKELKSLKSTIRDPIVHSGKSVLDLGLQGNDITKVVNRLIIIIISYCENVYLLGDISYDELKQEKQRILREHN